MQTKTTSRSLQLFTRVERSVLVLTMILVPLYHSPKVGGSDQFVTAKTILLAWLIGLLALAQGARMISEIRAGKFLCPPAAPMGWLTFGWAAAAAASLFSNGHAVHFFRVSLLQWMFLLWIWLLANLPSPQSVLKPALMSAVAAGTAVAIVGILQLLAPEALSGWLPYEGTAGDVRHLIFSTIGNPEHLGGYLAAILVLTVGLALQKGPLLIRLLLAVAILPQIVALMRTGARGAWIGSVAGMIVLAMTEVIRKGRRAILRATAAVAFILVLAGALLVVYSTPNPLNPYRADFLGRLRELRDPRSESVRHRLALTSAASRMIVENPLLGVGPGHFSHEFYTQIERLLEDDAEASIAQYVSVLSGRNPGHAHNDLLEFWAETGTVGFLFFAILVGYGLARLRRGGTSRQTNAALVGICLACAIVILIESLFGFPLHLPSRGVLFWTLLVIGAGAANERADIPSAEGPADADPLPAERA